MTLAQLKTHSAQQLAKLYEPREAVNMTMLLLEYYTSLSASQMVVSAGETVTPTVQQQVFNALERLALHEPVQYVLNQAWFGGLPFYVDENVLIPRPETDELVQLVMKQWQQKYEKANPVIIDIGTGSGCIPICLKKQWPAAHVTGIDISPGALVVAQRNAAALEADVQFTECDFRNPALWNGLPVADMIVSNPPYIPLSDKRDMSANVTDYEPHTALFVPNNNALLFYELIAAFGKTHLLPGGFIACEIHESLGAATKAVFEKAGYKNVQLHLDLQCKERMITAENDKEI
jgi:release factor glutamine methyltransferase